MRSKLILLYTVGFGVLLGGAVNAADFFVSPQGGDDNPGTLEEPFLTLSRAQEAAREADEAVNVFLRGGTYYLPATLVFTEADSGSKDAPVIYQAYEDEQPIISGGIRLAFQGSFFKL